MEVGHSLPSAVKEKPHITPKSARLIIDKAFRRTVRVNSTVFKVDVTIQTLPHSGRYRDATCKKQVVERVDNCSWRVFSAKVSRLKRRKVVVRMRIVEN